MNTRNLHQIFANYIDRFEELNNTAYDESFKWWAAEQFHAVMKGAFQESGEKFAAKLKQIARKNIVSVIIDGRMQPFGGLVAIAQKDAEAAESVRQLFQNLFADDHGDLNKREEKIAVFLQESEKLRLNYFPNYFSYKQTARSVAGYLFLYDPDHHYMYKATEARRFANCMEYYGDWGNGDQIRLKEYYRMCDELVEEIKKSPELLITDQSRYTLKHRYETDKHYGIIPPALKSMSEDRAKHILAYDIIYCNKTYDLDRNLSFKKLTLKEKKLREERLKAAQETLEKYLNAENHCRQLDEAVQHYNSVLIPGTKVQHRTNGEGIILNRDKGNIMVQFENTTGNYDFHQTVSGHFLKFEDDLDSETAQQYEKLFRNRDLIQGELKHLQKKLEEYQDILE